VTAAPRRATLGVMIRPGLATLLLALVACKTTAPHGVESAAINTALAVTVAGISVAQGGCLAQCQPGTTCNQKSGLCEPTPAFRCIGGDLKSGICSNRPDELSTGQPLPFGPGSLPGSLGISPATGSTPPPPAESSPRPP
jgi:hypothetical protein